MTSTPAAAIVTAITTAITVEILPFPAKTIYVLLTTVGQLQEVRSSKVIVSSVQMRVKLSGYVPFGGAATA